MSEHTIQLRINLVSKAKDGTYVLTLIEEGPWCPNEVQQKLAKLAQRICDCVTAIINGQLAVRYPDSAGQAFRIQVNSFETPRSNIDTLLQQLGDRFAASSEIQDILGPNHFATRIELRQEWVDWATTQADLAAARRRSNTWTRLLDRLRGA